MLRNSLSERQQTAFRWLLSIWWPFWMKYYSLDNVLAFDSSLFSIISSDFCYFWWKKSHVAHFVCLYLIAESKYVMTNARFVLFRPSRVGLKKISWKNIVWARKKSFCEKKIAKRDIRGQSSFKGLLPCADRSRKKKAFFFRLLYLRAQEELDKKLYIWKYVFFELYKMRYFLWVPVASRTPFEVAQFENLEISGLKTRNSMIWVLKDSKILLKCRGNHSQKHPRSVCIDF